MSISAAEAVADSEQYRRELTGYCYRYFGSFAEAEDAVQETMERAWRRAETFDGRSSLRTWLYRIATNICSRHAQGAATTGAPDRSLRVG
jgi:RNA polymerase sigma-70 factor (ECF subfamily)